MRRSVIESRTRIVAAAGLVALASLTVAPIVFAQQQPVQPQMHGPHGGPSMPPGMPPGHPGIAPHGGTTRPLPGHGAPHAQPHGEDAIEHEEEDHAPGSINWIYGFAGEKEGLTEPSLLWRPKGMPVPFLASIINFAILAGFAFKYGKKPLQEGLAKRKETLMREIDDASKVKAEAQARYDEYKAKLGDIDADVARIKKDAAEAGVRDQERLTKEAADKRVRMKKDAEFVLEQERKVARQALLRETVAQASLTARALLSTKLNASDQERLADEHVKGLGGAIRQTAGGAA